MTSIRVKLVAYFLVLSLLPAAAAYWGFVSATRTSEQRRTDERLRTTLRASVASLQDDLRAARERADRLASNPELQRALDERDSAALARALRSRRDVTIRGVDVAVGTPAEGLHANIDVTRSGKRIGTVTATIPFDRALTKRLSRRLGMPAGDSLSLAVGNRFVGPRLDRKLIVLATSGEPVTSELGGTAHRVLAARLDGVGEPMLAISTPKAEMDQALAAARTRLLFGVVASLLLIALVAYVEGASIARALRRLVNGANAIARGELDVRVPVRSRDELGELAAAFNEMASDLERERRRLRSVTRRFGDALAATHDVDQLIRVVVESAVELGGADGGAVVLDGVELVRIGDPSGTDGITLPLRTSGDYFGDLQLSGRGFTADERDAVAMLVIHAVVALENARLHRVVEQQARADALTGLPNRRHCEDALQTEFARAERAGQGFAFVLADVDDFKTINDRFGHVAGDRVLRAFGDVLRTSLRRSDLAARWGGDEFALILGSSEPAAVEALIERIRASAEATTVALDDGTELSLTASFGIATYPNERSTAKLVRAADAALYEAKRGGKNRVTTSHGLVTAA